MCATPRLANEGPCHYMPSAARGSMGVCLAAINPAHVQKEPNRLAAIMRCILSEQVVNGSSKRAAEAAGGAGARCTLRRRCQGRDLMGPQTAFQGHRSNCSCSTACSNRQACAHSAEQPLKQPHHSARPPRATQVSAAAAQGCGGSAQDTSALFTLRSPPPIPPTQAPPWPRASTRAQLLSSRPQLWALALSSYPMMYLCTSWACWTAPAGVAHIFGLILQLAAACLRRW